REVAELHLDEPTRRQAERLLDDIDRYLATAASSATRDRGLAESLLKDFVPHANAGGRAVFWAHNAHVSAGPLRYLRSTEPAAGGVLREALGDDYYAVGFAFGEGSFAALDEADGGGWSFASYDVGPPGPGLLCEPLWASGHGSLMLDLRTLDARTPKLLRWADTPAGQRWWGGYRVDADEVAAGLPADRLVPTHLRRDFDGLIYLRTTRATSLREQPE
ncbi:MAG: erythromycin esterase family protein, partial [Planctomycetota bacterium]